MSSVTPPLYIMDDSTGHFKLPYRVLGPLNRGVLCFFYGYGFYIQTHDKLTLAPKNNYKEAITMLDKYIQYLIKSNKRGAIEECIKLKKTSNFVSIEEMLYYRNIPIEINRSKSKSDYEFNVMKQNFYDPVKSVRSPMKEFIFNCKVYDKIENFFRRQSSQQNPVSTQMEVTDLMIPAQTKVCDMQKLDPNSDKSDKSDNTCYEEEIEITSPKVLDNVNVNVAEGRPITSKRTNVEPNKDCTLIIKYMKTNSIIQTDLPIPNELVVVERRTETSQGTNTLHEKNVHPDLPQTNLLKKVTFIVAKLPDKSNANNVRSNLLSNLQNYWRIVCRFNISEAYLGSCPSTNDCAWDNAEYIACLVALATSEPDESIETLIGVVTMKIEQENIEKHGAVSMPIPLSPEEEEKIPCYICGQADSEFGCRSCNHFVHRRCVPSFVGKRKRDIIETEFFCSHCELQPNKGITKSGPGYGSLVDPNICLPKFDARNSYLYIDTICSYYKGFGGAMVKAIENDFFPVVQESYKLKGLMLRALTNVYMLYARLGFTRTNNQGTFPLLYVNPKANYPLDLTVVGRGENSLNGFLTYDITQTPVNNWTDFKTQYNTWFDNFIKFIKSTTLISDKLIGPKLSYINKLISLKDDVVKLTSVEERTNKVLEFMFENITPLSWFIHDGATDGYLFTKEISSGNDLPDKKASKIQKPLNNVNNVLNNLRINETIYVLYSMSSTTSQWFKGIISTLSKALPHNDKTYYVKAKINFCDGQETLSLFNDYCYETLKSGNANANATFQKLVRDAAAVWRLTEPNESDQLELKPPDGKTITYISCVPQHKPI